MTISELFGSIGESIGELLGRIALAFTRTFNLVTEGKLGDLVLSDLGIIAVTVFVGLIGLVVFGFVFEVWREGLDEPPNRREDHRDGV